MLVWHIPCYHALARWKRTTARVEEMPVSRPSVSIPGTHKIAVLRAKALGDLIFSLPALHALRAAYPQAEIVLLAKPWLVSLLHKRPSPVDRTIGVPGYAGVTLLPEQHATEDVVALEHFFAAMERERFDLAVQLHGGGKHSNPFVQRLGATTTLGLCAPNAPRLDRWVPYHYYQNEVLRCLEVVALAGATPGWVEPRFAVTADDEAEAERIVPQTPQPLVVLHPGASDPRRRWPADKFAVVGDALAAEGVRVAVTGTAPERAVVDSVLGAMRSEAIDLCGGLSLGGLAGLLARCRVVVSNDSGPLHLAGAVGAPTVGVYWCGNMINAGPATRTWHRTAISWRLACPVCGRDCTREECDHQASFVADVAVEEVLAAARDLLDRVA
jgi:ADP-heptose:LPS heptosyltransferase